MVLRSKSFLIFVIFNIDILYFSHLKKDVEQWLQVMLEWDPEKRGRYENASAFKLLQKILQKKVISNFYFL